MKKLFRVSRFRCYAHGSGFYTKQKGKNDTHTMTYIDYPVRESSETGIYTNNEYCIESIFTFRHFFREILRNNHPRNTTNVFTTNIRVLRTTYIPYTCKEK